MTTIETKIARAKELAEKATPGPIITEYPTIDSKATADRTGVACIGLFSKHEDFDKPTSGYLADVYAGHLGSQEISVEMAEANAQLFAESRTLLPDLASECERLQGEVERLREEHNPNTDGNVAFHLAESNQRENELRALLEKAKQWNALTELELKNLRCLNQALEEDLAKAQLDRYALAEQCAKLQIRVGELEASLEAARKVPFPWRGTVEAKEKAEKCAKDLRTMLRELCEKMESGISGAEETKRARALIESHRVAYDRAQEVSDHRQSKYEKATAEVSRLRAALREIAELPCDSEPFAMFDTAVTIARDSLRNLTQPTP